MENQDIQETQDKQILHIKGSVEALLFVNDRPITIDQIRKALGTVSAAELKKALKTLQDEYEERDCGMTIQEIAGGYQMLTNPIYAGYVREFFKTKVKEKLSKPALEACAIIAYKQPVTRVDVESIRGVNSDGVVNSLLDKELVKIVGRKDVPGKPYLYGTTKQFLEYFGLKSLTHLPKLEEFPDLAPDENQKILPIEDEEQQEEATDQKLEESQESEQVAQTVPDDQESSMQGQQSVTQTAEKFLEEAEENTNNDIERTS